MRRLVLWNLALKTFRRGLQILSSLPGLLDHLFQILLRSRRRRGRRRLRARAYPVKLPDGSFIQMRNRKEAQFGNLLTEMGFPWEPHPRCLFPPGLHRHDVKILPKGPLIEVVSSKEKAKRMCCSLRVLYMAEREREAMKRWIQQHLGPSSESATGRDGST